MQSSRFCYKNQLVDIVSESVETHNSFKAPLFLWIARAILGVFL